MTWYKCRNNNFKVPHRCNTHCAVMNDAYEVDEKIAEAWWEGRDYLSSRVKELLGEGEDE